MLQPSSSASVLGDFSQSRITLRGTSYRLHVKPDGYFINEQLLSGGEREHRVDYTLGSRRIQHYLTRLADGRIIVLPPSWDVLRKQWFHNFDIVDPQETEGGAVQVWNKSCYSCHVTREEKNFDAASNTYNTTWQDFGTSCERCHGQGAGHMLLHRETPANSSGDDITRLGGLDPARSTAVCAQCHSLRDMLTKTFAPGQNYLDSFMPILEYGQKKDHDPAYWVDGRPRRFSNDAIGFWQSACFMRGDATCLSCNANVHDPAIPANRIIREEPNALCSGCHGTLSINVANHSHHAAGSRGSECVECHMPRSVFSLKAEIRDHSMSIPDPENTLRHGIPNACGNCHRNRDATWAADRVRSWYGPDSGRKEIHRAKAFRAAGAGDKAAIPLLLSILNEASEGTLARANALGHLSRFPADERVVKALQNSLQDPDPLLRAVAAVRAVGSEGLSVALADPVRSVRVGAAFSIVNLRVQIPAGKSADALESVSREYEERASILADDGPEQFNLGGFELLRGNPAAAEKAFRASMKLDGRLPSLLPRVRMAGAEAAR
ncbi:MAG: hypothetical protein QOJ99_3056 [Bryobacterales bacterium]|nr:hypothetical protein [Bryobacterales bacterium]